MTSVSIRQPILEMFIPFMKFLLIKPLIQSIRVDFASCYHFALIYFRYIVFKSLFQSRLCCFLIFAATLKCDARWTLNSGNCYQFNDARRNWDNARQSCKNQGGDLATINTNRLHSFVISKEIYFHDNA